jgi:hypothetical protein
VAQVFKANEVEIGYHPDGYRIDRTASPMNRYTRWQVSAEGRWSDPEPVCFDSLPQEGWLKVERFDWEEDSAVEKGEGQVR